jgi:putative endonuclease
MTYWVYILASWSRTLYVGVTNDLVRRIYEHKYPRSACFTSRYRVHRLVYCEGTEDVTAAIAREKQLKRWLRSRKIALIESANPTWADLGEGWFDSAPAP